MTYREKRLEYALLLMVYQYCHATENGDCEYLHHQWMSAGETAFDVLGLSDSEPSENVWKRIKALEKEGIS